MIIPAGPKGVVHNKDAAELAAEVNARVAYLDPPYTKRQYAAYYHLPDTIIRWDEPEISADSKSGLRSWETLSSDYCYKRKAEGALEEIVANLSHTPVETILMSYNSDGQMKEDQIRKVLGEHTITGEVEVIKEDVSRYEAGAERSEDYQTRGKVQEWLFIAKLRDR